MQGHKGSFQREKSSRQKNTRKTKKQKTNKQTKKNTRLNKYINTPRFVKLQFHFRLWLALSSHGNYKTSKVNVIQNWGLLLSSTCKMPWILPSLIYKVDGMTYTLKSPRFSSRSHKTTYGGKAMPESVHGSCCWQLLRRHTGLSASGSVSR